MPTCCVLLGADAASPGLAAMVPRDQPSAPSDGRTPGNAAAPGLTELRLLHVG